MRLKSIEKVIKGEEVEMICVESFYNLFCCEGENNTGVIVGGNSWVSGVLFGFVFAVDW